MASSSDKDRDREDSPDWLRAFQPPSTTTVSSDSGASADKIQDDNTITTATTTCKRPSNVFHHIPTKRTKSHKHIQQDHSDSPSNSAIAQHHPNSKNPSKIQPQHPFNIGQGDVTDAADERLPDKHIQSRVSSSTLSLLLPEKVSRSKVLVECEGESIDLSGDMGAVGRVIIPENPSDEHELFLDLKGTIYKTAIVPSRTFCVVSIGPSEAKIEAIMNDFIQLKAQSNVYDAETMVEGTLEGFAFDSEDEADKTTKDIKTDENEEAEEQAGKKKGGKVEKKLGVTQKKGKATAGKQAKKRKPQATKKSKGKK